MDLSFFNDYMMPVVLGICLCTGYLLKNMIQTTKINKYIPTIVAILGVVLSIWISGWTITPEVILSGMVSGLSSTGMHQLFKQYIENKPSTKE